MLKLSTTPKTGVRNLGSEISSPSSVYVKSLCLCVGKGYGYDRANPREWYMLHMSSDKDKYKEEEEKKGIDVLQIPTPEHRGSYLAFHHDLRHQGQRETSPPRLITKMKDDELDYNHGCLTGPSKVIYYNATRPEDGWKIGPRTICGRESAQVAALHGKLYVFGGGRRVEPPDVWAEFLDTTLIDLEEEGKGKADWRPLHKCPALGCNRGYLVAACAEGKYSGHIFVATKSRGPICLYYVTREVWKNLRDWIGMSAAFNPIVVGTTIYWIDDFDLHLYAYDIVGRREFSMPLGDFDICHHQHSIQRQRFLCSLHQTSSSSDTQ